jgi:alkylation response protein AidB-like acyl-CoA dehydrogenase
MPMELDLTKEQEELRQEVKQFAEQVIAPFVASMEERERFPAELVPIMGGLGYMGLPIQLRWGGRGSDFIAYTAAIREIARISAAAAVILSVHTSVVMLPLARYGTDEQREQYLRQLAAGSMLGAFALTEQTAGSDAAAIRMTATRDGNHYRLHGSKLFITNAEAAHLFIVFAATDPGAGSRGLSAFLVERGTEGLRIGSSEKKMGLHGSSTCELYLDQVAVPLENRLGQEGEGFAIAKNALDGGRIGIAAQALGIAEAALELARSKLGKTGPYKSDRLLTQHEAELAQLLVRVEAARLLVFRAASLRQADVRCTREASLAKLFASDTAVDAAKAAVRLLGLDGCREEQVAARLLRDAKVTQIYEGTNEIQRVIISNQTLKRSGGGV